MQSLGLWSAPRELLAYRHLLWSLAGRELRVRYKQSVLGIGWAVLIPLSTALIFAFVFTRAVNVVDRLGIDMPYVLFAYIGLVPWTFFAASLNGCVNSLVANRSLVTKVYFPREVFPLSSVASALIDCGLAWIVLLGLTAYFHFFTGWTYEPSATLLFVPLILIVQIVLTAGVGMLLAMANLFFRDVRQIFSVAINLWMFLTCVVYPLPADASRLGRLVALNPMTPIIEGYRNAIIHGQSPFNGRFALAALVSAAAFGVGWWCFRRKAYRFAECI